ncbi:MAG: acetylornithine deacetylase [Pseudomonadota bacterium]
MADLSHTLDILRTLVAFPTVSSDSNLALIAWVEEYLDAHQVPHWRVNESASKSSVLARIGPDMGGGIVLSGHTDVVPVKDQPWLTDPFTLTERDGHFYGRGTSDMKSFLALALAHVPLFQASGKTVWLAFSHDEEIGCLGAAPMAEALVQRGADPSLVVIGEPTMMQLIGAHKGILSFETIITGREAHSSMPQQGVNAVMLMGELLVTLNRIATSARATTDVDFAAVTPYASVHVGVIEGGTARNIIPRHCRIAWEVRPLPGTDVAALLAPFHAQVETLRAAMQAVDPQCSIVTNQLTNVRGLQKSGDDAPHLAHACRLASANRADAVAFGTEGGIFQGYGLPTIVCGPGSIDQAHQPNEFITREQLERGAEFMVRVGE